MSKFFEGEARGEHIDGKEEWKPRLYKIWQERLSILDGNDIEGRLALGVSPEEVRKADEEKLEALYREEADLIRNLPVGEVQKVQDEVLARAYKKRWEQRGAGK